MKKQADRMILVAQTIKAVANDKLTRKQASEIICCDVRTVQRILKKYLEEGDLAFVHKNSNRSPINKISDEVKLEIIKLYKSKYQNLPYTCASKALKEEENIQISPNSLKKILIENNINPNSKISKNN
ncbi:MAG: helix-turn-helix domain-containing protein [Mycoplasma sp.]